MGSLLPCCSLYFERFHLRGEVLGQNDKPKARWNFYRCLLLKLHPKTLDYYALNTLPDCHTKGCIDNYTMPFEITNGTYKKDKKDKISKK